jgi:hypothetical protein
MRPGFYTCFISFTEADERLARQVYLDLTRKGVRCWRWKEDATWGRTLMGEIDRSVRSYDKLVVLISKASIRSEPVIREIERALQKEQRSGQEVLFPVRVDDAVFAWSHPLQADVVRKVVGDFRAWREERKYRLALRRLLQGLERAAKSAD